MAEFKPEGKIIPTALNSLQVQALRNELFGHPGIREQYTTTLKAAHRFPPAGTILQFRPRQPNSSQG